MTLEDRVIHYEAQTSNKYKYTEPPETTPKKSQTFKDFKVLATTTVLVEADRLYRRFNRVGNSGVRARNNR